MRHTPKKPAKAKPPKASEATPDIPRYYMLCRLVCFIAITAALIAPLALVLGEDPMAHISSLGLAAASLIYSLASYKLYYQSDKASHQHMLNGLDGLIVGLAIAHWFYSPWASLLLVATFYFNALYHGGLTRFGVFNLGLLAGGAIAYFALGKTAFVLDGDFIVNAVVLVSAIATLCAYSFHYRQNKLTTDKTIDSLNDALKDQKLRFYEISKFVPKSVWDQIEGRQKPKIERKPITVFFSDIVGFSRLSEQLEAETLSNVLSSYLAEMSKIVEQYDGTIDKFIGDAIMVTFGDDDSASKGVKADAIACVSMAIAMGKRMRELQPTWAEMGIKQPLQIRIGINSGYCTVGTFGISKHLDHTALGVHVNLASRLESAGQPEEILVSHETWSLIKDTILCKDKGKIKAKGFTHPVQVYQVINHRKELGANQSYFAQNTEGFSIHLDMEKVKNYDRDKVIAALEKATKKLREQSFTR